MLIYILATEYIPRKIRQVRSERRTTTAVLRLATGLSAVEFAQLIGKSLATVKAIESGKLALSVQTAAVISAKTGIGLKWLLTGDPAAPMTDADGEPWSVEMQELAGLFMPVIEVLQLRNKSMVDSLIQRLRALTEESASPPPEDFYVVLTSIDSLLEKLEKAYPARPKRKPKK
jgi:transcriptional regulator with XRE-family HTH domain